MLWINIQHFSTYFKRNLHYRDTCYIPKDLSQWDESNDIKYVSVRGIVMLQIEKNNKNFAIHLCVNLQHFSKYLKRNVHYTETCYIPTDLCQGEESNEI